MKTKNYNVIIEDSMTETKPLYVFISIIEFILGLFLIIYPIESGEILTIILGAVLTGVGVFNVIAFLMNKNTTFRQGILSGVISAALGVAFIMQAETVMNVTSIILGVFVIFEGLTCCKRALIMKRLDFDKWFIPMIIAILACVLGALILIIPEFFAGLLIIITGIALAVEAVLGIVSIFFIIRLRKRVEEIMENSDTTIIVK